MITFYYFTQKKNNKQRHGGGKLAQDYLMQTSQVDSGSFSLFSCFCFVTDPTRLTNVKLFLSNLTQI